MRDVNILRAELARHGLGDRAQAVLGAGEGRVSLAAAQACGRAGEEDAALAARQHQARGFAAGEKSGIAAQFPHLAKHAFGGVEQRKIDVAAHIEDADFERRVRVGGAQKRRDVILLAGIEPARHDRAAGGLDRGDQRRELVGIAPSREDGEAFSGEFLRNRRADEVAGADHRCRRIALGQRRPSRRT